MTKHQGRLELTWTDKDKTLLSTGDGKYDYTFADPLDPRVLEVRLLHQVERVSADVDPGRPAGLPEPTDGNLLITGDAMHALDALSKTPEMAAKYLGKVKLVYIDPPFNTGQTFANYEDNIEHSIWLTMLRDRLKQIKPLLAEDASVWVHLDDMEVHRCRAVMDEQLGADRFVATIVWEKDKGRRNDTDISSAHDYVLVYAPLGRKWKGIRNLLPRTGQEARYKNPDNDPRGPWLQGDNGTAKSASESSKWPIVLPSGRSVVPPPGRGWAFGRETFATAREEGRVYFGRNGDGMPIIKSYLSGVQQGVVPRTWWTADEVGHNQEAKRDHINKMFPDDENGFATPKPERLLERIIHIATNPGDVVLDCFAGSGTTAAVAHKMGRRWVTSELLPETVDTFTKPRLKKVLRNEDPGGITTTTVRLPADGVTLPDDVTPRDAQEFQTTLGRVLGAKPADDTASTGQGSLTVALDKELAKVVRASTKAGTSTLTPEETRALLALLKKVAEDPSSVALDVTKHVKSQLTQRTKTRDETTVNWHGGGGFTHARIGPSMYEVDEDGDVFLSPAATNGAWSQSVAAQLRFTLTSDHPVFCGVRGRQRLAVIDGVADEVVVKTVVEHLRPKERAVIVAKVVLPGVEELLSELSTGSRIKKAPRDLFPKKTVK